jgi:hypothetical protein
MSLEDINLEELAKKEIITKPSLMRSFVKSTTGRISSLLTAGAFLLMTSCSPGGVNVPTQKSCDYDAQCDSGQICSVESVCIEEGTCLGDPDCPPKHGCLDNECIGSEIPKTTKELSEKAAEHFEKVSADQSTLTFSNQSEYAKNLNPQDVMVIGITDQSPDGLLRKVVTVNYNGDKIVVETIQADFEDMVKKGKIKGGIKFSEEYLQKADVIMDGVNVETRHFPLSTEVGLEINFDNTDLYKGLVFLDGYLYATLGANFEVEIDWFKVKEIKYSVFGNEELELIVSGEFSKQIHKELPPFEPVQLPSITFFIPGTFVPVVITPNLTITFGLDAYGEMSVQTSISQSIDLEYGLEYKDQKWSPIKSFENNFDFTPLTLGETSGNIEVYAKPKFALDFYSVAGPYGAVKGYLGADAEVLNGLNLTLYTGLDVLAGVHVEVFGKTLADYETTVYTFEKILWTNDPSCTPLEEVCNNKDDDCDDKIDEGGVCGTTCEDECDNPGKYCSGNEVVECKNVDGDSCLEKTVIDYCGNNETCQDGECVPKSDTCEDACNNPGVEYCSGNNAVKCGYVNGDDCLDEGITDFCGSDEICQDGECVPKQDDCQEGNYTSEDKLCSVDNDCVTATCCHVCEAVNKAAGPYCGGQICTPECVPNTLDCGQGEIKCIDESCEVILK